MDEGTPSVLPRVRPLCAAVSKLVLNVPTALQKFL